MSTPGQLTSAIALSLTDPMNTMGYNVFSDHDPASGQVGKIVSHISEKNQQGVQLSQLDMAIVDKKSGRAVVLIEIEETNDRPKTLLGDIFGVLIGERITFHKKELKVGKWTTLLILGFRKAKHEKKNELLEGRHAERILTIINKVEKVKPLMETGNSKIGKVMIKTFAGKDELEGLIRSVVENAR